jgi:hypothetical protein
MRTCLRLTYNKELGISTNCLKEGEERYDKYNIYAGFLCDEHWKETNLYEATDGEFDPDYAGESLEEDE